MAARSDRQVAIEFTGLRPGQKLHEVLLSRSEVDVRPAHPLISRFACPPSTRQWPVPSTLARDTKRMIGDLARLAAVRAGEAAEPACRGAVSSD